MEVERSEDSAVSMLREVQNVSKTRRAISLFLECRVRRKRLEMEAKV